MTQDDYTDRLFLLHELLEGGEFKNLALSQEEIQGRADVTYPVMAADGSRERTIAPTPQSTLVAIEKK